MAKVIRLRLTGQAEELWETLRRETRWSDEQLFSRVLWLTKKAYTEGKLDQGKVLHIPLASHVVSTLEKGKQ